MTSLLGTAAFLVPRQRCLGTYARGAIDSLDLLALVKLYVSTNRLPHYRRALTNGNGEPSLDKTTPIRCILYFIFLPYCLTLHITRNVFYIVMYFLAFMLLFTVIPRSKEIMPPNRTNIKQDCIAPILCVTIRTIKIFIYLKMKVIITN